VSRRPKTESLTSPTFVDGLDMTDAEIRALGFILRAGGYRDEDVDPLWAIDTAGKVIEAALRRMLETAKAGETAVDIGMVKGCLDLLEAYVAAGGATDLDSEIRDELDVLTTKVWSYYQSGALALTGEWPTHPRDRAACVARLRPVFNAKSQPIVDGIKQAFETFDPPLTVRQVYYQLASSGLVPLSKSGYGQAQRLQLKLRELGIIPWDWYADRGRERIKPSQWGDAADFADTISDCYRKDLWQSQPEHVEFWLEKDALSAFVADALEKWGNPLCVVRGFSSATFVYECAEILKRIEKPKFIYFLGDHDPSGLSIESSVRERLSDFGAEFSFKRLAIGLDDIEAYGLRPLEAKQESRRAKYVAEHGTRTVEIDALPPNVLRERVRRAVEQHVDIEAWERLRRVERIEQDSIRSIADRMRGAA
jgi:hypothetical protein